MESVIQGIVTASKWGVSHQVTGLTIETPTEEGFDVDLTQETGLQLRKLLQQRVEVVGQVDVDVDGRKVIHVRTFRVMRFRSL